MLRLTITRPEPRMARIALSGELDRSGVDAVGCIATALGSDVDGVVVDLTDLAFVDVGGWRSLDRVTAQLQADGVRTELHGVPDGPARVRSLLHRLRLAG